MNDPGPPSATIKECHGSLTTGQLSTPPGRVDDYQVRSDHSLQQGNVLTRKAGERHHDVMMAWKLSMDRKREEGSGGRWELDLEL